MDKAEKKRLLREIREKEKKAFFDSLPMRQDLFKQLFDYLDKNLGEKDCNNTLEITVGFLDKNNIPIDSVIEWLNEHGGYCDCEVLANVEEHFV